MVWVNYNPDIKGGFQTFIDKKYRVNHSRAITMKMISTWFSRYCYHLLQVNHCKTVLRIN